MVKVSVVIPVYNVEQYLRECMDSIVNQTLDDIEIICINDGSTDNSLKILQKYANKDNRIIIKSQENGGHAVATNRGMDLASGKYIFLMDSDDTLELNALEKTYLVAEEKDVDFVIFKAINYDNTSNEYYESEFYSMNKLAKRVGDNIFCFEDIGEIALNMAVTPWTKLYKKSFIDNLEIRFPEGLIFEDNIFFWEALLSAEKIYFLKEFLFTRRWYDTSSTKAGDKRFVDSIIINSMIIDVIDQHGYLEDTFKQRLFNRKLSLSLNRFKKIKKEFKGIYFEELQKNIIHWTKNKEIYNYLINNLEDKNKFILNAITSSSNANEFELKIHNYEKEYKNKQLTHKLRQLDKEIQNITIDLRNTIYKNEQYTKQNNTMINRNKILQLKNQKLIKEYEKEKINNSNITQSIYWKITKPIRRIIRLT